MEPEDPWHTADGDPWQRVDQTGRGTPPPYRTAEAEEDDVPMPVETPSAPAAAPPSAQTRRSTVGVGVTAGIEPGQGPARFIHDIPPNWDGGRPDKNLEPYIKALRMWLHTTKVLKQQQGMAIFQNAQGDLKQLINELEIEQLTIEDSGEDVLKHIQNSYAEYLERSCHKQLKMGWLGMMMDLERE